MGYPILKSRRKAFRVTDTWSANNATLSAQDGSLVAYWALEDTSDSKGSNTLTNTGSATFSSGKNNNALDNSGLAKYLSASHVTDFNFSTDSFTINVWHSPASGVTYDRILGKGNANLTGWLVAMSASSNEIFVGFGNGSSWVCGLTSTTQLTDTSGYYMITIVREGEGTNETKLYINGGLETSATYSGSTADTSNDLFIGHWEADTSYCSGQTDEVSIWNGYGADTSFVSALYNSGTGAFYTG